jgi:hypothetical protein
MQKVLTNYDNFSIIGYSNTIRKGCVRMKKRVLKYKLLKTGEQTFELPVGTEVLSVEEQGGVAVVYAIVPEDVTEMQHFEFLAVATGETFDDAFDLAQKDNFVGTAKVGKGVVHVFLRVHAPEVKSDVV